MIDTFPARFANLLSSARQHLVCLACLLGLAAPVSAQVIIASAEDECIPVPEEGIFCGEDPGGFEIFRYLIQEIYGEATEPWWDGGFYDGFSYSHSGHPNLFFDYTLREGSRLTIAGSGDMHYRGIIQGAGSLRLLAGGTLLFDRNDSLVYQLVNSPHTAFYGRNTYSGGTEIAGGWLKIYDDASLGTGALTLSAGGRLQTLAAGSLRGFTVVGNDNILQTDHDLSIADVIAGDGRLNKAGAGTLTLSGTNTYTGGTHVAEGALAVSTDANLGAADTRVSLASGAKLVLGDGFASSQRELELQGTSTEISVASGSATWNGVTAGSGQLVKQGAGTLTLAGANTYTGATHVAAGTLRADAASAFGASTDYRIDAGATLDLNGYAQTVTRLSGAGSLALGSATLTINPTADTAFAGAISGTGGLTVSGTGALTLSGANTYSGATKIAAGTLNTGAADTLSASSVLTLLNGATLNLQGHNQTVANLNSRNAGTNQLESSTIDLGGATLKLQANTNSNSYWAGSLVGQGDFVKATGGTLYWSGANSFTGTLRVERGTVRFVSSNVASPNAVVHLDKIFTAVQHVGDQTLRGLTGVGSYIFAGSSSVLSDRLTLNLDQDSTFSGQFNGFGNLIKNGAGTLTLDGRNLSHYGRITVGAGTLRALNPGSLSGIALYDVAAGATLDLRGEAQYTAGLAGAGSVVLNDTRLELTLSDSSGYLYDFSRDDPYDPTKGPTFSGTISGHGGLVIAGDYTQTLLGHNTYTGGTTLGQGWGLSQDGTLRIQSDTALGDASGDLTMNGGTLRVSADVQSARAITLVGTGGIVSTDADTASTLSGVISGSGGLTKTGAGALTLSGANTYTGATTVTAGTLRAGASGAFGSSSAYAVDAGATLDLNNYNHTFAALSGAGNVALGSAALTLNQATDTTFSGVLSGTGSLTKSGAGTLTLAGLNTYTGATTVSAGTLRAGAAGAFGSSSGYAVASGATLDLAGFDQTVAGLSGTGNVTLGTATLTLNQATDATFAGAISGAGSFTKTDATALTLTGTNTYSGTTTVAAGTLRAGAANTFSAGSIHALGSGATLALNNLNQTVGGLSGSGNIALGSGSLTLNQTTHSTFAGAIAGTGGVTKTGAGSLTLSGASTYSGGTVVSGGIVRTGAANVLSANSAYFLIGGSTLALDGHNQTVGDLDSYNIVTQQTEAATVDLGGATLTNLNRVLNLWAGSLTGHGTLVKKGTTEMKWYAANTFTGTLQIDAGTVSAQAANVFSPHATISLASGSTLQLNSHAQTTAGLSGSGNVALGSATLTLAQSADSTFSGIVSGTGSLIKNGAGILTLAGVNTYSGGTTLRGGTLRIAADSALGNGSGALTFDSGTLQTTANFSSARAIALVGGGTVSTDADTTAALSGILSGSGAFTKIGSGTLTLAAANTYSGGTTLRGGALRIAADSALGNATGAITFDGGALQTTASLASARAIALAANGGTLSTAADTTTTLSGVLSGAGALTKTGTGTLTLTAANTYSGATTVSAGTLRADAANAFSAGSAYNVAAGATLDLNNHAQTLAGLIGTGVVSLGSAALTVSQAADTTFSGVISGTGNLTKAGSGALTLSGANTYSGGTTIAAGTLIVGHASALGTDAIALASGATLDLGAHALDLSRLSGDGRLISAQGYTFSGDNDAALTLALGGTASIAKTGAGTLTLTGANTYSGGTTLSVGTIALASNSALGTGTLTLDGGTLRAAGGARTLANAVVLNADTTIAGTDRLTVTGSLTLARNRDLAIDTGATLALAGGITQNGGPRALLKYGAGTLELTGASTYTGGTTIAVGTVRINNATGSAFGSGAVTIAADGTLTGAGVFSGALQNDGVYAPGNSPALASLSAFSQGPTGILEMEIAGLARGTGYDALDIAGTASLGGTLDVVTYGAFTPASFSAGQSFDLFNWGSVTGTFSTLRLPDLSSYGLTWDTSALYTTGVLSVTTSAVPEPTTCAAILGACAIGFVLIRRRRVA